MLNSIDNKNTCPLEFSYTSFGNGYVVSSDHGQVPEDRVFLNPSGVPKLQKLCAGQETCDNTTCTYQQELIRALLATSTSVDPKQA